MFKGRWRGKTLVHTRNTGTARRAGITINAGTANNDNGDRQ
jgi:hypothetical protein